MPDTYCRNLGHLPRCPKAPEDKDHTYYLGDGAHNWGNGIKLGNCLYSYTCKDCGVVMTVDSSD